MSRADSTANKLIKKLSQSIEYMEGEEIAFLEYVDEHGPKLTADEAVFLRKRIESNTEFMNGNAFLLRRILTMKEKGALRSLDTTPFRTAVLRLKAAIEQAVAVCKGS